MASKYEIRGFTKSSLTAVENRWRGLAGEDEFASELAGFFQWCHTHIAPKAGDSQAHGLFNKEDESCDAIIELVETTTLGGKTKLLKLITSPHFWQSIDLDRERLITLYTWTFTLVIAKGILGKAKDVKLYARDDLMLSFLRSLHAHWDVPGTKAEFQGRFLTVTKETKK